MESKTDDLTGCGLTSNVEIEGPHFLLQREPVRCVESIVRYLKGVGHK